MFRALYLHWIPITFIILGVKLKLTNISSHNFCTFMGATTTQPRRLVNDSLLIIHELCVETHNFIVFLSILGLWVSN